MARISEGELDSYDIELLKNMCIETNINENMINTMNKNFLIKLIMWKERQTEKFAVGEYEKYKQTLEKQPEKSKKYIPPHLRENHFKKEECLIDTSSDSFDTEWDSSYTYKKWYMPGDEMKTFTINET